MMRFEEFNFAFPVVFWGLASLPVLIALFFAGERKRRRAMDVFLAARLQSRLAGSVSTAKRRWAFLLNLCGFTLAVAALAQPRWGFQWEERAAKGRDIIFAIDTSRSMLAQDLKPNRMARAKLAAQDLLDHLEGDRVGLVAFAGTAFLQAPLTGDYNAIRDSLAELDTEIIPRGGTNLTAAIETATDAFGKGESEYRALIIFTDGEELEADAVDAAREARSKFRVFTVGLGSKEGSLIPFANERGGTEFVRDDNGQYVTTRLDEGRLQEIAEAAAGFYVHLQSGPAEMQQLVHDGLGKMKESHSDSQFTKRPIERYQWPLAAAATCFIAALLLGDRRRVRKPVGAVAAGLLFLTSGSVHAVPEASYNRGVEAYRSGDYVTAAKAFSEALGSAPQSLQPHAAYNLANTLARRGATLEEKEEKLSEWKNALQHYDRTLALVPNHADAKHNRELLQQAIESLEKPEEKQQNEDEKKEEEKEKKDQGGSSSSDQQNQDEQKSQDQKEGRGGQEKKDEQKKDGGQKSETGNKGEKKEQQQQEQGGGSKDGKNQQPQDQQQSGGGESNEPKPGEQEPNAAGKDGKRDAPKSEPADDKPKTGDLKAANDPQPTENADPEQEAAEAAAAAAEGRMTPKDAKLLLEAMKKFDERVRLLDPREAQRERFRRGFKDW